MGFGSFFKELKSRSVLKGAIAYMVFSWIIIQVASILFPTFNVSQFWLQFLVIALIVGLGIWVLICWHFEIGPAGIRAIKPLDALATELNKKEYHFNYILLWIFVTIIVIISLVIYIQVRPDQSQVDVELPLTTVDQSEKSVAVLAFLDLSPDRDHEYFSDGISEEILNYLSKNRELRVISRTSSFSFKEKQIDIKTIGQQLNANYILEGSVRKADSNLRITAQLIRTGDGVHLWSETYQRKMADVFDIQDEIAREVSRKLEVSLLGHEIFQTDPEAYTKFLQAKSLSQRFNKESSESGLALINESLQIDSTYASAWLLKSKMLFQLGIYANDTTKFSESRRAVERAVSINPQYAEAFAWLGRFNVRNSDFEAAYNNYQRALAIDPESSEVLRHVSSYPAISVEDRIFILQKAIKIDPLDSGNYRMLAIYFFFDSEFQKALDALDSYLKFQPYGAGDHGLRGELLAWLGRTNEAFEEVRQEEDDFSKTYSDIMISLVLKTEGAGKKVEENKQNFIEDQPYLLAQMYAYQNEKDKAYEILNKALMVSDYDMYFQLKNDPYMNKLKNDMRFENLLNRMPVLKPLKLNLRQ